ncbi:MAG: divalent metal cation transporter [Alphaproteobacteria bacterium]|nr:divalent metal cation transporter [Alphaproteobacteria bacterium]
MHFLRALGPGLLMASAAIGVSHFVQSTRAGADYGLIALIFILAATLFKYPFFEFGHRFAGATRKNLLDAYLALGKKYLILFLLLNVITGVGSIAAVTFVTASIFQNLTGYQSITFWSACIFIVSMIILLKGQYSWLDRIIKFLMVILIITTIIAFFAALEKGVAYQESFISPSIFTWASLPFLIALMGWMPGPIEMSAWQSLWVQERERTEKMKFNFQEISFDFNFSYLLTVITAVLFLSLGYFTMHGTGESFSAKGAVFAGQVIELYTRAIGEWTKPIIGLAAFAAMFSTSFTLVDAYPRALSTGLHAIIRLRNEKITRGIITILCCLISLIIIGVFTSSLKVLVDVVTSIAFIAAPIFAWLNYKVITSSLTPKQYQPKKWLLALGKLGLTYLVVFSVLYIWYLFFYSA